MIPVKDASLIARCLDSDVRREWRGRLVDHDGTAAGDGGIARWLKLTDGLGLDRRLCHVAARPAAGDALLRSRPMCISSPRNRYSKRSPRRSQSCSRPSSSVSAWKACSRTTILVTAETLAYFSARPPQAQRDSDFALAYVKQNAKTPKQQALALKALEFKCDVLWVMLDALHHAYVSPKHISPGAFVPE